jgi:nitrite reductase (NADH) large subunit
MQNKQKLVVIGNGMAGVACVEQILRHKTPFDITIFGEETHVNYNRILLSAVLAGERNADEITLNEWDWYRANSIDLRVGVRIIEIDAERKCVVGDNGVRTPFDKLIIATGSSPFIPPIPGIEKEGVFTFRNLADTRALLERSSQGTKAVVIGGGLLGLEAARGLQAQGCDVTVVHLMGHLMERQLDPAGGAYLRQKMEALGLQVFCSASTRELCGNGRVEEVALEDGRRLPAEMVVIAAGIRPNVDIARRAGLKIGRGIVVDDYMTTSNPDIFAVGECTEHKGQLFGLVAPLIEQGKVLAATITGNETAPFSGTAPAAKLKIMGVDVFSAGEIDDAKPGMECVRFEDPGLGIYKKLLLKDSRLAGVILVGDASDSHRYVDWLRTGADLTSHRRSLLFPPPAADAGVDVAQMPDNDVVCGCHGVSKGRIIAAIHQQGVATLAQLREATRASTGCGSCTGLCQSLLKAVVPDFSEDSKKVLCGCVPFSQEQLRDIIKSQKLKSVQEVLDIYGDRRGCHICKPALSYLVDVVWCGDH